MKDNILLICSEKYCTTLTRRFVKDIELIRQMSTNLTVIILKNSYIEKKINSLYGFVKIEYLSNDFLSSPFNLHNFFELRKHLRKYFYDVIHCYNLNLMLYTSLVLINEKRSQLYLTSSDDLTKFRQRKVFDFIIKRIKKVFVLDESYKRGYFFRNSLLEKKVINLGMGNFEKLYPIHLKEKIFFSFITDQVQMRSIQTVLNSLNRLNHDGHKFQYKLFFYRDSFINESNKINNLLYENKQEYIKLYYVQNLKNCFAQGNIYVSLNFSEAITDWEIKALESSYVLGVRSVPRVRLASNSSRMLHFKNNDSRELYTSMKKCLRTEEEMPQISILDEAHYRQIFQLEYSSE